MERIDDLQRCGYKIIQDSDYFCFGLDAVLLSVFITLSGHIDCDDSRLYFLDMCSGNGIIPLLLAAKTSCDHIYGIEIQEQLATLALRSVELNALEDRVHIINDDILNAHLIFKANQFSAIFVNPPYIKAKSGIVNADSPKAVARHEILCTLDDICRQSAKLLADKCPLFMVHKPHRLVDIICTLRQYGLEAKRLRFVHPFADSSPNMVLIEAIKGGGNELTIEKPLVIFKEKGVYTKELQDIYRF